MNEHPFDNLDDNAFRIAYLIAGYLKEALTEEEHKELDDWVNASDQNMLLFEELTDEKNVKGNLRWIDQVQTDKAFREFKARGGAETNSFRWIKVWLVAASIIAIVIVLVLHKENLKPPAEVNIASFDTALLKPGGYRAILRINEDSVIDLASERNGNLFYGDGSHVSKPADGELVYVNNVHQRVNVTNHTLSTPVGGQYKITMSDGTKVWLNAATRLRYPSQFKSEQRVVELDGEAYFEVAKSDQQPFKVILKDSMAVTVLGTHFNVMSYRNEETEEVTLLEGKVFVEYKDRSIELEPGMQAIKSKQGIRKAKIDDYEVAIAWKKGMFVFQDATIETIMRQIERWYGAEVVYEGKINDQFNATIFRDESLEKLLRLLQLNGHVKFKIENTKIYVYP